MGFNCGIVGLPNVGKSTLFNALTSTAAAAAANYPFCTIEPNTGRVPVPDPRLDVIAKIAKSEKIIETQLEVIDIAGLVRGASKGEGLGNQFLGAIRGVDAILHVLRCFDDDDVTHVEGGVDPVRDAELINTELLLADLASLEKRSEGLVKRARGGDKEAKAQLDLIERIKPSMEDGQPVRGLDAAKEDAAGLEGAGSDHGESRSSMSAMSTRAVRQAAMSMQRRLRLSPKEKGLVLWSSRRRSRRSSRSWMLEIAPNILRRSVLSGQASIGSSRQATVCWA